MSYEFQVHSRSQFSEQDGHSDDLRLRCSFGYFSCFARHGFGRLAEFFSAGGCRILWRVFAARLDGLGCASGRSFCLGLDAGGDSWLSRIRIRSSGRMDFLRSYCCHRSRNGSAFDSLAHGHILWPFCRGNSFLLHHQCCLLAHHPRVSARTRRFVDVSYGRFAWLPAIVAFFPQFPCLRLPLCFDPAGHLVLGSCSSAAALEPKSKRGLGGFLWFCRGGLRSPKSEMKAQSPAVTGSLKNHLASWAEGSVAKVCKIKARVKQHFFCKFVQAGRRVLEIV